LNNLVIGIIAAIIILYLILSYNRMKRLVINIENAFADLDAFLMKRVEQLDNLIETAKSATEQEKEILENVTGLRTGIMKAHDMDEKVQAHMNLERELPAFYVSIERYPDVKFNKNYLHIQRSINEIEEQIQAARRNYNSHVGKYNKAIAVFPQNIIATIFRFTKRTMFEAPPKMRKNPDLRSMYQR